MRRLNKKFYSIKEVAKILDQDPLTIAYWIGIKKMEGYTNYEDLSNPKMIIPRLAVKAFLL